MLITLNYAQLYKMQTKLSSLSFESETTGMISNFEPEFSVMTWKVCATNFISGTLSYRET